MPPGSHAARAAVTVLLAAITAGCAAHAPGWVRPAPILTIALPAPASDGPVSLEHALAARRSVREFTPQALTIAQLGQLLWAGQGVTDPSGGRTAPSAGALYPLELYAVTADEVLHYLPAGHRAGVRQVTDLRPRLAAAAFGQDAVRSAPVVLVVAAAPERSRARYGARATAFIEREAGHATQNVLLQASAMGLGAVPIGALDPQRVARAVPLPPGQQALYLVPVGHPR